MRKTGPVADPKLPARVSSEYCAIIKSRLKKARFTQSEASVEMGLESRWLANVLGRKRLSYKNAHFIADWICQNAGFEEPVRRQSRREARAFASLRDRVFTATKEEMAIPLLIPPSAIDEIAQALSLYTKGTTPAITVRNFFRRKMANYGGLAYAEACAKEFEHFIFGRLKATAEANPGDYANLSSYGPVGKIDLGEAVTSVLELAGHAEPTAVRTTRRKIR